MKKINKQLPKAQWGNLFKPGKYKEAAKAFANVFRKNVKNVDNAANPILKADGTVDKRFKVNRGVNTDNTNKGPGFLSRAFSYNLPLPSIKNITVDPIKLAWKHKGKTALLGANASLAYYLLKRGDGIEEINPVDKFDIPVNLNNLMDNTYTRGNDSIINPNFRPNINNPNYLYEKKGGPVKARGGKTAPGMKSKGGGLKMDSNGKFYR